MKNYKQFKKEVLQNKEVKKAYNALDFEFSLINQIIEKRLKSKMSQKDLAKKLHTGQSAISRLESGNYNPTLSFLKKLSIALDTRLEINLK